MGLPLAVNGGQRAWRITANAPMAVCPCDLSMTCSLLPKCPVKSNDRDLEISNNYCQIHGKFLFVLGTAGAKMFLVLVLDTFNGILFLELKDLIGFY